MGRYEDGLFGPHEDPAEVWYQENIGRYMPIRDFAEPHFTRGLSL